MGIVGAGKTCVTAATLGEKPPELHDSTPFMKPVQSVVIDIGGQRWERKKPEEVLKIFADYVRAKLPSSRENTNTSFDESGQQDPPTTEDTDTLTPLEDSEFEILLKSCDIDETFVSLVSKSEATAKVTLEEKFVHIVDSGGQPQFMEVLQVFLKKASACIFVMRLCDALDEAPTVGYYKQGKSQGNTYRCAHTNEQIFQKVVRTVHSFQSMSSMNECPKILVVGTHKDKENECPQKRSEKNKKLKEMLTYTQQKHLIFTDSSMEELIFAINAQDPRDDEKVLGDIRNAILKKCEGESQDIPLRWYFFLNKILWMAEHLKRKVLKKSECIRIASTVGCDEASCEAALKFFDNLNQLFYFHTIEDSKEVDDNGEVAGNRVKLKDLVFVNPMVLIDKITKLVERSYYLHRSQEEVKMKVSVPTYGEGGATQGEKVPSGDREVTCSKKEAISGDWQMYRDYGRVSETLLCELFPNENPKDVFTTKVLIELFCALLVFGKLPCDVPSCPAECQWFMPSLLPPICKTCLKEQCKETYKGLVGQTMAVHFSNGGPQNGMFCSLGSYLPSRENTYPKPWDIARKKRKPICLKQNCIEFAIPGFRGTVKVIDYFYYFVIHVVTIEDKLENLWGHVWNAIFAGLKKASDTIGYRNDPKRAIFCPCSDNSDREHLAILDEKDLESWNCSIDAYEGGKVKPEDLFWITPLPVGELIFISPSELILFLAFTFLHVSIFFSDLIHTLYCFVFFPQWKPLHARLTPPPTMSP